jgi:uncharacterized repeat protein (TIGR01451 family)
MAARRVALPFGRIAVAVADVKRRAKMERKQRILMTRRWAPLLAVAAVVFAVGVPAALAVPLWNGQFSGTTNPLYAVSFVDQTHGWAVGYNGTILTTSDGGSNWATQTSGTTNLLDGVSFVDQSHGWAVGKSGTILATNNGGSTWAAEVSGTIQSLAGVSFVDPSHGWAVGDSGTILATSDGGATWDAQTSGTTAQLTGVSFVDQSHGVAVGGSGTILATNNSGSTWVAEVSGTTNPLFGVSFVDPSHGWAVGDGGTILETNDEGLTWTAQTSGTTAALDGVSFVDQKHGWAVAYDATVLVTSDGGATWSSQGSGTSNALLGVSAAGQDHAWAVGDSGTIRMYVTPPTTLGLSSSSLAFGNQVVGSTSSPQTITITNTALYSNGSLVIGQLAPTGANAGDFALANDTCSNATIAASSSCTVDVEFEPTSSGARSASLRIPSNAASSPDQVTLSGNGTTLADMSLAVSGPSTAASGSQDTYVFTVSNAGPTLASGVVLAVQVPNGTKFVGVTTTQGSCTHPASGSTSGTISCALGDLATGAAALNNVALKITLTGKGGNVVVSGKASSSTTDPNLGNNVASQTTLIPKK